MSLTGLLPELILAIAYRDSKLYYILCLVDKSMYNLVKQLDERFLFDHLNPWFAFHNREEKLLLTIRDHGCDSDRIDIYWRNTGKKHIYRLLPYLSKYLLSYDEPSNVLFAYDNHVDCYVMYINNTIQCTIDMEGHRVHYRRDALSLGHTMDELIVTAKNAFEENIFTSKTYETIVIHNDYT